MGKDSIAYEQRKGGCWLKDFVSFIKNYATRDFIYFFSEISIELYKKQQNKSEGELRCSIVECYLAWIYTSAGAGDVVGVGYSRHGVCLNC